MVSAEQQSPTPSSREPNQLPSIGGEDPDFVLAHDKVSIMCTIPVLKSILPSCNRRITEY